MEGKKEAKCRSCRASHGYMYVAKYAPNHQLHTANTNMSMQNQLFHMHVSLQNLKYCQGRCHDSYTCQMVEYAINLNSLNKGERSEICSARVQQYHNRLVGEKAFLQNQQLLSWTYLPWYL